MKKFNFKNENGFVGTDAFVSILIIVLFATIISALIYNIYIVTSKSKRNSKAVSLIVDIFEHADKEYYSDVTKNSLITYINNKYNSEGTNIASAKDVEDLQTELTTPYRIEIDIIPYDEQIDLVKTIQVSVKYNLNLKEQTITMTKVKVKENLITPNEPDLDEIEVNSGYYLYLIKYVDGTWYVTNKNDTTWYNYTNGYWATVFVTDDEFDIGDPVNISQESECYIWIPRYAYNTSDNTDIEFLYKNTDYFVDSNGDLEEIDTENYNINSGGWADAFEITDVEMNNEYLILENVIGRNNI